MSLVIDFGTHRCVIIHMLHMSVVRMIIRKETYDKVTVIEA